MQKPFEFLDHTSEIKFKAYGKNINEVFQNSVLAISSFISKDSEIKPKRGIVVEVSGTDKENLLYKFVEEILTLLDSKSFVVANARITILGNNLKAELFGDDASNYKGLDVIKSPTYAEMHVKELPQNKGWEIQAVLDV